MRPGAMCSVPINLNFRNDITSVFTDNAVHRIIIGASIINRVLTMNDMGDIIGVLNNNDIFRSRNDEAMQSFTSKIVDSYKIIVIGTEVVIGVDGCVNPDLIVKNGIRWQWCPPSIRAAVSPGNPCRCPFSAWNPDPT